MPRRPKPPLAIITVHGLSTCKSFADLQASEICDLTGELIPISHEVLAQRVINNPKVITDYRKRMRAVKLAKEYLEAKRYTDQRDRAHKLIQDKLNPPKPQPKPAHNQVHTASGLCITIRKPHNPLRRL